MAPYRIFISSILNRSTEDLSAEREAAREAIESIKPITEAWAFEAEPASTKPLLDSYLDEVKACDLFVLIVGRHLTEPVRHEYETAHLHGKLTLIFAKSTNLREPQLEQLLRSADLKYDPFESATDLAEKVKSAVVQHIRDLLRGDQSPRPGDRLASLQKLNETHTAVTIEPAIPPMDYNSFNVQKVEHSCVEFMKASNHQLVVIPAQRIEDILITGQSDPPKVMLNGRLQWITFERIWRFFPEKPDGRDPLGFGKVAAPNNPGLSPLQRESCTYTPRKELAWPLSQRWAVFYDRDGKYVTTGADEVLIVKQGS